MKHLLTGAANMRYMTDEEVEKDLRRLRWIDAPTDFCPDCGQDLSMYDGQPEWHETNNIWDAVEVMCDCGFEYYFEQNRHWDNRGKE